MIFVNFKTYEEGTGEKGLALLNLLGEVSANTSVPIVPIISALDLAYFTGKTLLPLWVQHIDPVTYGAHTGSILPERVFELQAKGVVINHSENPLSISVIKKTVQAAKSVGLKTLVFAKDIEVLEKVMDMDPDFVSYEPPELVGSTEVSVSSARPEIISEAVDVLKSKNIPLIVGAGIHSTQDVVVALERGSVGIAVATKVVKSENQRASIEELLKGFK